ncbi:hypothetical protein Pmob_1405 [Petrotoga mobilis SJ95]|jgi:hypothetical protein|uniref:Uncharacterized protein n=1 Tax=Petrotoga mobilis (strain DSM 10674 / SJ95) TaxID=403833 RepID=A9BHZ3_PETMO|nr:MULTISPECIES: hypothetical protein [Petrotoga]MDK2812253.1 hypothetical protein [Petrotoga sp.]ABX32108.1 hypothetical protein Pmob_1405 [Petrotoga mobilis SJ95]MBL5981430.1 hypothetical protein [Petrotoga sp. 8T1HF07.NaAc.6.1]PNR92390.1 hypothetical protein X926_06210 [Petrotoga sp. HWHPT.55.6.3]RPD35277.1 hypothetical protein HWHPT5561_07980 [Petrotoga sp. HWH.PT.55.6.1]
MASLHELQILVTKSIDVANNVQAISHSYDAAKNMLLVKQASEYSQNLQKRIKSKDQVEKKNVDNKSSSGGFSQRSQSTENKNSVKRLVVDEYRGKLLDLRL